MNLREKILSCKDGKVARLTVDPWGEVFIRTWTGTERAKFQGWFQAAQGNPERMADLFGKVALISLSDEDGKKVFTDADLPALCEKSAKALEQVALFALKHNTITPEAVEEAKADFPPTQN